MHFSRSCVPILVFAAALAATAKNSFSDSPVTVAEGQGSSVPKQPQASVGDDGVVHLVYGIGDKVHYSNSKDKGKTFESDQPAFQVPNMSLGMRRGPRIALSGKAIVVTAVGGVKGKGQDGDVLAWRSNDGGATWKGPTRVNDVVDSAREGLHAMASAADGTVWCLWLDLRDKRTDLFASKSTDGGATWSDNTLVYRSPEVSICQCCHPSIAIDGNHINVLFRNSLEGNRDMYIVTSTDGGKSFHPAKRLGQDHWALNACPMDGGMLAIGSDGKVATVWRRAGELFFTSEKVKEASLGKGEQPWVAPTAQGPVAVWTEGRVGKLRLRSLANSNSKVLDEQARDPVIVSNGDTTIACWESIGDSKTSIVALRVIPD